jgi:hypothetical protein
VRTARIMAWPARTAADVGRGGGHSLAAERPQRDPSRVLLLLRGLSGIVGSTWGGGDDALDGLVAARRARPSFLVRLGGDVDDRSGKFAR